MDLRNILLATATALLTAFPAASATTTEDIEKQLAQCDDKGGKCIDQWEAATLAYAQGKALRKDGVLTLQTKTKTMSLADRKDSEGNERIYRYLGYLDAVGYHVVMRAAEERRFIFISERSGDEVAAPTLLHFSPSKKKAVSVSASEGCDIDGIVIWSVMPDRLSQETKFSPPDSAAYRFLSWEGESAVRLEKFTAGTQEHCPKSRFMTVDEMFKLIDGVWQLSAATPLNAKCR